jgi:hypothetical protein
MHSSRNTISNGTTHLANTTSCQFPRFSRPNAVDTAAARRPFASARVAVEQADNSKLLKLAATDADELAAILAAAWALLLRCYTGQDDVNFGLERVGDAAGMPVVARFHVDDSESAAGIVGHAKTELTGHATPAGDHPLHDTTLFFWGFNKSSALYPGRVLTPVYHSFYLSLPLS